MNTKKKENIVAKKIEEEKNKLEDSSKKRKISKKKDCILQEEAEKVAHLQGLGPGTELWRAPPASPPSTGLGTAASPPSSFSAKNTCSLSSSSSEGLERGSKGAEGGTDLKFGAKIEINTSLYEEGERACAAIISDQYVSVPHTKGGKTTSSSSAQRLSNQSQSGESTNLEGELGLDKTIRTTIPGDYNHPKNIQNQKPRVHKA